MGHALLACLILIFHACSGCLILGFGSACLLWLALYLVESGILWHGLLPAAGHCPAWLVLVTMLDLSKLCCS
jgi:hypothetical protein